MRDFNRNHGSGRGRSFGDGYKRNEGRGFDRPRPTMYPAICSNCGKECEVPFKPTGEKPVFCRDCFREKGGDSRRPEERNFSRPAAQNTSSDSQFRQELATLNEKVDRILTILNSAVTPHVLEQSQETVMGEALEDRPVVEKKKKSSKKAL